MPKPGVYWDVMYFFVAVLLLALWQPEIASLLAAGITAAVAIKWAPSIFR
ncbi:MAG: hypothetical protein ACYDC0_16320 [Acidimicrobiales bacterium]